MNAPAHSVQVTLENFEQTVLETSMQRPVLVDFSADWCAPCRVLMPILDRLAARHEGRFLLGKVDTDDEQKLAGQWQIRGFPTVKLFVKKEVVAEFSGARPESEVDALLQPWLD